MPSVAESPGPSSSFVGKKRRRDDERELQMKLSSPHHHRHSVHEVFTNDRENEGLLSERDVRRIMPRPRERRHEGKRQRVEIPLHEHDDEDLLRAYERERDVLDDMAGLASHHGQSLAHSRDRDVLHDTAHHAQRREGKVDLSPCHICHRKPTAKHELDSFADCEECGKRTCWICIRECLGMGMGVVGREMQRHERAMDFIDEERRRLTRHERGEFEEKWEKEKLGIGEREPQHRGRICSRCCVERGTEGEVWCLGCLRAEGGG